MEEHESVRNYVYFHICFILCSRIKSRKTSVFNCWDFLLLFFFHLGGEKTTDKLLTILSNSITQTNLERDKEARENLQKMCRLWAYAVKEKKDYNQHSVLSDLLPIERIWGEVQNGQIGLILLFPHLGCCQSIFAFFMTSVEMIIRY